MGPQELLASMGEEHHLVHRDEHMIEVAPKPDEGLHIVDGVAWLNVQREAGGPNGRGSDP